MYSVKNERNKEQDTQRMKKYVYEVNREVWISGMSNERLRASFFVVRSVREQGVILVVLLNSFPEQIRV